MTMPFADVYSEMLIDVVLNGMSVRDAASRAGKSIGLDVEREVSRSRDDPMTACYITGSFPALLFFAYKYGNDAERCLLASTNAGGENVARGSLLGALLGAQEGFAKFPKHLKEGLVLKDEFEGEFNEFIKNALPEKEL